jgi:hypothetical protein
VRPALALVVLACVAAGCGGGGEPGDRAAVRAYLERVNQVQAAQRAPLKRADAVLRGYAQGSTIGAPALEGVEADIRRAREAVAAVKPPALAQNVHTRLLNIYDVDAGLAHETLRLVRYQEAAPAALKPVDHASTRLSRDLRHARQTSTQVQALTRFKSSLQATMDRLNALDVPVLLAPAHADQLRRLRESDHLTGQLRTAVRKKDSRAVAKLLLRFRKASKSAKSQRSLSRRGIAAYTKRLQALTDAQRALGHAQADLTRSLRT